MAIFSLTFEHQDFNNYKIAELVTHISVWDTEIHATLQAFFKAKNKVQTPKIQVQTPKYEFKTKNISPKPKIYKSTQSKYKSKTKKSSFETQNWLFRTDFKSETTSKYILNNSGVFPAHFPYINCYISRKIGQNYRRIRKIDIFI